ncbi:MAG: diguanylate cyclase, partial [Bacteroidota bacterium]|nr:diguanylate cyclase [Bacteroidota bacterium]
ELLIANEELVLQNKEKEKRAAELIVANKELAFQNVEKEKRAAELIIANDELKKTEAQLKEHIRCLEEMMFVISHKVRQPVVNILGLSNLIDLTTNGKEELNQIMLYIKQSALSLDTFTKELTTMIDDLAKKDCDDIINE